MGEVVVVEVEPGPVLEDDRVRGTEAAREELERQRAEAHQECDRLRAEVDAAQAELAARRYGPITTEIAAADEFYYAEDYHQQYLAKNPSGYCGLGGTGVCYA